jgi:hypothetical protein
MVWAWIVDEQQTEVAQSWDATEDSEDCCKLLLKQIWNFDAKLL